MISTFINSLKDLASKYCCIAIDLNIRLYLYNLDFLLFLSA